MGWTTFGKIADIVGVAASGISTGLAAKDILDQILDPNAGVEKMIEGLSEEIDAVRRDIDRIDQNALERDVADKLIGSYDALSDLKGFLEMRIVEREDIRTSADDGLEGVLSMTRAVFADGEDLGVDALGTIGASLLTALTAQHLAAVVCSEGAYAGVNPNLHGGEREHGGYRDPGIRDNMREAISALEDLQARTIATADVQVSHESYKAFATDGGTHYPLTDWFNAKEQWFSYFMAKAEEMNVVAFDVTVDISVSQDDVEGAIKRAFSGAGDDNYDYEITSGATSHTARIVVNERATVDHRLVKDQKNGLASDIKDAVYSEIVEGSPLDRGGYQLDRLTSGYRELIDGQYVTDVDDDGIMRGTTEADLYRDATGFLTLDGDDFLVNIGAPLIDLRNPDSTAVEMHGFGGDDYLKGADRQVDAQGEVFVAGNDKMYGGTGDDIYYGGSGDDLIVDEAGTDTAIFSGKLADYQIEVTAGDNGPVIVLRGADGTDTVEGVEFFKFDSSPTEIDALSLSYRQDGTDGADILVGWEGRDEMYGLAGDDHLRGGAREDTLDGGAGDDWLDGGRNADRMIGGAGNDTYRVDAVGDRVVETAAGGVDTVITTLSRYVLPDEVENLEIWGASSSGMWSKYAAGYGNASDNVISGSHARNYLSGGAGDDTLDGGGGMDILRGGSGADVFVFSDTGTFDRVADFRSGEDKIALDADVFTGLERFLPGHEAAEPDRSEAQPIAPPSLADIHLAREQRLGYETTHSYAAELSIDGDDLYYHHGQPHGPEPVHIANIRGLGDTGLVLDDFLLV